MSALFNKQKHKNYDLITYLKPLNVPQGLNKHTHLMHLFVSWYIHSS